MTGVDTVQTIAIIVVSIACIFNGLAIIWISRR